MVISLTSSAFITFLFANPNLIPIVSRSPKIPSISNLSKPKTSALPETMGFMNPPSLIHKLRRSHSKKSYEQSVHEDDQVERSKKKRGSAPKGSIDLFVGKDEKKYPLPLKYFTHPKLQELIKKYQGPVFDPRFDEPIVVECSTETFEQLLRYIVKNR